MVSGPLPGRRVLRGAAAFAAFLLVTPAGVTTGAAEAPTDVALRELTRVRDGLKVDRTGLEDLARQRRSHGRPAEEVEGWRLTADNGRWPVDQATFDHRSGLLSKYVNFGHVSRRRRGETILPMSVVSTRADGFLALFYPDNNLSLEEIERLRVRNKESIYYELRYSPHPQDIPLFHPLVRMLIDASTGRLYRFEMAVDYLEVRNPSKVMISAKAAEKIAGLYLRRVKDGPFAGGVKLRGKVFQGDLFFVRPNGWIGGRTSGAGTARAAWVVPFEVDGQRAGVPHLIFIDAVNGRILGGVEARPGS